MILDAGHWHGPRSDRLLYGKTYVIDMIGSRGEN